MLCRWHRLFSCQAVCNGLVSGPTWLVLIEVHTVISWTTMEALLHWALRSTSSFPDGSRLLSEAQLSSLASDFCEVEVHSQIGHTPPAVQLSLRVGDIRARWPECRCPSLTPSPRRTATRAKFGAWANFTPALCPRAPRTTRISGIPSMATLVGQRSRWAFRLILQSGLEYP